MMVKKHFGKYACLFVLGCLILNPGLFAQQTNTYEDEIFYHIFLRSFYDSNGDSHGDLKGLQQKLDYLQDLGVTAVLITPLYDSDYYHNYFPNDFEKIDAEFGSKEDYFNLLSDMHSRGMKLIMDMEIHYVTERHLWYKDSYQNPGSKYSKYIIYNGPENTQPETIIFDLKGLESYDGTFIKITTTDLFNPDVQAYHHKVFKYWVDPNQDGNFDDGIDGFRLDHIMDNLDWKNKFTNLLSKFWKPLFEDLGAVNPDLIFLGEQAEWGYGHEYFEKGDLTHVFAFPLSMAIREMDAQNIINKIDSTRLATPAGKEQFVFVENHDMSRVATEMKSDLPKLKLAAALNLLVKGVPIIYYGQELGMTGKGGFNAFGQTDGNDIPRREAFEWYKTVEGPGMALWYKNSGPWWDQTNLKNNDGISLEEQKTDRQSLYNFYRKLINIRKENTALSTGDIETIHSDPKIVSFIRKNNDQIILVLINPDDTKNSISLDLAGSEKGVDLLDGSEKNLRNKIVLQPNEIKILELN
ncbi:MAG: alpha-amylase [Calditrichae bacterium]|nr:alpha-amylase [Calditrichia bacterium]